MTPQYVKPGWGKKVCMYRWNGPFVWSGERLKGKFGSGGNLEGKKGGKRLKGKERYTQRRKINLLTENQIIPICKGGKQVTAWKQREHGGKEKKKPNKCCIGENANDGPFPFSKGGGGGWLVEGREWRVLKITSSGNKRAKTSVRKRKPKQQARGPLFTA